MAGHIPGAINLPYEDNLHVSGRLSSPEELRELYLVHMEKVKPDRVVLMCGSGVTACHNILAMEHAGLPGAKLYAGSWSQWISDRVATGGARRLIRSGFHARFAL
ncbi:MAG: rhodanese-like domain-containing protein [Chromatiales bacterium]|nr:rhodanese-like domain-containing protein [Chromatiales bacterium]